MFTFKHCKMTSYVALEQIEPMLEIWYQNLEARHFDRLQE